jgi:hypothetical protein
LEQLLNNQEEYNRYLSIYWPLVDERANTVALDVCNFHPKWETLSHNGYLNWIVHWLQ